MTEKEMKKFSRANLLEMLLGQMEENRKLKKKIKQMEKELSDRSIAVEESGSIAEAALRLNRVFEAAQQAADQYLENIQKRYPREYEDIKREDRETDHA